MPSIFRTRAKELALTWPKTGCSKGAALDKIKELFGDTLVAAAVAQELHEDGTPHLHAWIHRDSDSNVAGSLLDKITGKHGNYQPCRSRRDWLKYVTKSDEDVLLHGIDMQFIDDMLSAKKGAAFAVAASQVKSGKTLREINEENPGFVLNHMRKLKEYIPFVEREQVKASKPSWEIEKERLQQYVDQEWNDEEALQRKQPERAIAMWLIRNIKQKRPLRTRCLWVYSKHTGMGKTTLVAHLAKYLTTYMMPKDESFFDFWEDGQYDLIVLDEYKSQHKLQVLNEWAGGSTIPIRVKGAQSMKNDNVPMLILSNFPPAECYPKASQTPFWSTFLARWVVVELSEPMSVVNGWNDKEEDDEDDFDYFNF